MILNSNNSSEARFKRREGEFDKISIEHISEELSEKRKALQDDQKLRKSRFLRFTWPLSTHQVVWKREWSWVVLDGPGWS